MLVYRAAASPIDPRALIDDIEDTLAALRRNAVLGERWTDLLLQCGELEAAVIDAIAGDVDDERSLDRLLRALTVRAANGLVALHDGRTPDHVSRENLEAGVALLRQRDLPSTVRRCVPEGYAYYALYPEMYARAAARFAESCAPRDVTVVGIRTIGTSLSAVVHAVLSARGCHGRSITVRPHGHPFSRTVHLGPEVQRRMRAARDGWFAIVDEGPGLSGSSFAAAADAIAALGVSDERIVFFPSWLADGSTLRNESAQARWHRHAKFASSFEEVWLDTGRLAREWQATSITDWSAGKWRDDLRREHAARPPAHPQHEQRKYRLRTNAGELVVKFVGLGRYGAARLHIANRLAELGFVPEVLALRNGFLASRFMEGAPLDSSSLDEHDLERIGAYIAARPEVLHGSGARRLRELEHLSDVNIAEALGDDAARRLASMRLRGDARASVRAVAVDGRMQAHEWLRSGQRLVKTDGMSHYDDHFQPGPQDPAWDLAGAVVELGLTPQQSAVAKAAYLAATGDVAIGDRLPFYRAAYLTCRYAYASLCRDSLGDTDDGHRFAMLANTYRESLQQTLSDSITAAP